MSSLFLLLLLIIVATTPVVVVCYQITDTTESSSSGNNNNNEHDNQDNNNNNEEDCINDLSIISLFELQLLSTSSSNNERRKQRQYILCPNTIFKIGNVEVEQSNNNNDDLSLSKHPQEQQKLKYINGSMPLVLVNPNVFITCGVDGKSSNQCVLRGGDHQIIVPSYEQLKKKIGRTILLDDNEQNENLVDISRTIIRGLTLEGSTDIAFSIVSSSTTTTSPTSRGGITIQDCIFQNQIMGTFVVYLDAKISSKKSTSTSSSKQEQPKQRPVTRRYLESPWDVPFFEADKEGEGVDKDDLTMALATQSPVYTFSSSSSDDEETTTTNNNDSDPSGNPTDTANNNNDFEQDYDDETNTNNNITTTTSLTVTFDSCQFRYNHVSMAMIGSIHDVHLDFQSNVFYKNEISKSIQNNNVGSIIWVTSSSTSQKNDVVVIRLDSNCFIENLYGLSAIILNGNIHLLLESTNYMKDYARYYIEINNNNGNNNNGNIGCDEGILKVDNHYGEKKKKKMNLGQALVEDQYECFYLSSTTTTTEQDGRENDGSSSDDKSSSLPTCATMNYESSSDKMNNKKSSSSNMVYYRTVLVVLTTTIMTTVCLTLSF